MRTRVSTGSAVLQERRDAWRDLAANSPSATPFQTWEWHSSWYRHYGRGKKLILIEAYEGQDLVALMPLVRSAGAWSVVRSMGTGPSDYLHPLVREGYEAAVDELQEQLQGLTCDVLDLHQVRTDKPGFEMKDAKVVEQGTCLVLDLPGTYDDYLSTLGKSLRYDVRKLDKALFSGGTASIEPVTYDGVTQGLEILFEQHRKRWKEKGLPGAFLGRAQRFQREWAHHAAKQGWLWLSILRYEGEAVGAIYAMTFGETVYYYQAGFDPEKKAISPGTLLVANTIRRAISEGKTRFDFLRGDEPYKRRWKPQHEFKNIRRIVPLGGLRAGLGADWNKWASGIEAKLRDRLEGGSLWPKRRNPAAPNNVG